MYNIIRLIRGPGWPQISDCGEVRVHIRRFQMKKVNPAAGLCCVLCFLLLMPLQAKKEGTGVEPEEIIEKSIKAQGGRAVLESVKDSVVTASCKFYTPQGEYLGERKVFSTSEPMKIRIEQTVLGTETIIGYDGEKTWLQQAGRTMEAPATIHDSIEAALSREDFLLRYKEKGIRAEYQGESQVEESPCHTIKFTDGDGDETLYYFDVDTFLPLKVEYDAPDETGKIIRSESINSDFRKVENMMMPFKSVFLADSEKVMETMITEIKINQGLDESLFSMPEK